MSTNCLPIVFVFRTISILTLIFLANMYSPIDNELMNTKYDASERSLVCRGSFILYFGLGKFCTWLSAWKWNPPIVTSVFFYLTLEIWLTGDIWPVFQPGESEFGVKNIKKWHLVGPHGPWMSILCIIKSNFENPNFSILISDLDCLQKSIITKCSSFFHILIRT